MNAPLVGQPILRLEDGRFLTGNGRFTEDHAFEHLAHAVVLRSPHAHARILRIDTAQARSMPGVLLILTGDELDGIKPMPTLPGIDPETLRGKNGRLPRTPDQWPLAKGKVRFVGDPVVFIVAENLSQASDAAERVVIDYETLPAVVSFESALAGDVRIWDEYEDNKTFEWEQGDKTATDRAFASAAHVVSIDLLNNRQIVAFMEPRSIVAHYVSDTGKLEIVAGGQSAHAIRNVLSEVLALEHEDLHVVVPDTGGGFGARNTVYPEFVLSALATRRLGRPVRWVAQRSESFLTDTQARDQSVHAELALDEQGRFLAIRTRVLWRHGAYIPTRSLWVHMSFMAPMMCGTYQIPHSHFEMTGLFSNTAPVHAFRGVGRAEAAYIVERLADRAASELKLDRVAIRRLNLIPADHTPCKTGAGAVYGRCEFEQNLDRALALCDWKAFETRRAASRERGLLRGLGLSSYIESTGGMPTEFAEVDVRDDHVIVYVGTKSFGMGHETVFAQVIADELGLDLSQIVIKDGDTALVKSGAGSHGSRSMRIGGGAIVMGARNLIDKARQLAGDRLEAAHADIRYERAQFTIDGTDRSVSLFELAEECRRRGEALCAEATFHTENHAYANGCHVCEVEIDPETGVISLMNHVLVTDVGIVVNPIIVAGQLHGGIVQGMGQALFEQVVYEEKDGQMLSASFMDYTLPRADDLCNLEVAFNEVRCDDNPLGAKGAGEGPTTGCPPAVVNAVADALHPLGVQHIDMPLTPARVWQYIHHPPQSKEA